VRTIVRDVRHEVANLRGGTQEISAGNHDMSSRTESQASSLEETAASMEEINGTIQQTAHLAVEGTGWRATRPPWPSAATRRCSPWPTPCKGSPSRRKKSATSSR
jgi:hypothetical protein